MPMRRRKDLPACREGMCFPTVQDIFERFEYVRGIVSRSGATVFHVVEANDGFHAFVEINGKFYATGGYSSLEGLEGYIF
ncbi:MAG: hypothetical protein FJ313_05760 [Gemmatimonadetes bacterium]|nr:hypothetical protein [Gemmatimonadota bacterium]